MDQSGILLSVVVAGHGSAESFQYTVDAVRSSCRNPESIEVLCLVEDDPKTEQQLRAAKGAFLIIPTVKSAQWDRMVRGRFVQFLRPGQEVSPAWFRMALLAFREADLGAVRGRIAASRNSARQEGGWLLPRSLLSRLPEHIRPSYRQFDQVVQASVTALGMRAAELPIPMAYEARDGLCGRCRSAYFHGQTAAETATGPGEACLLAPVARPVRWAVTWVGLVTAAALFPQYAYVLAGVYLLHVVLALHTMQSRPGIAAALTAPFRVFPEALGVLNGLIHLWRTAGRTPATDIATKVNAPDRNARKPVQQNRAYLRDDINLS